jgi:hypothetical protein
MNYKQLAEGELGVAEELYQYEGKEGMDDLTARAKSAVAKASAYALLGILEQLTKLNTIAEEELITKATS